MSGYLARLKTLPDTPQEGTAKTAITQKRDFTQFTQFAPEAFPAESEDAARWEGLRRFCPGLGRRVRLDDGREGVLWGVTGHGLIVARAPGAPMLTLRPDVVIGVASDEAEKGNPQEKIR